MPYLITRSITMIPQVVVPPTPGWHVLPHGAGGLITGMNIAPDNTMVIRSDVGGAYRWSGTTLTIANPNDRWIPLLTQQSLGGGGYAGVGLGVTGCLEIVIAPSLTTKLFAIFPDNTVGNNSYIWYSTNSGTTWTKVTSPVLAEGNPNTLMKFGKQRIAVDPENPNIVYVGMWSISGTAKGVYRSTNGTSFSAVSALDLPTQDPGACGIFFDQAYTRANGTITAFGQQVSRRIIVPVAGKGIYESLDGGQNWTETAITAFGGAANINVWNASMDYDGVYYCITYDHAWRYKGGVWDQIDSTNVSSGWWAALGFSYYLANAGFQNAIIADPRNGHQGRVNICGPNGMRYGFSSNNANLTNINSVTWSGSTGGVTTATFTAPYYDIGWFAHRPSDFLLCAGAIVDQNGDFWWHGNQGFWKMDAFPLYPANTNSTIIGRGTDMSVTQDILRAPGSPYPPVTASQDVGIVQGTLTEYATDYYKSGKRMDCDNLCFAASDSKYVFGLVDDEANYWPGGDNSYGGWSNDYGNVGTWTAFAQQPAKMWQAQITGSVSSSTGKLTVASIAPGVGCGKILIGMMIFTSASGTAFYPPNYGLGRITGYVTGTGGGVAGGTGDYTISQTDSGALDQLTTVTLYLMESAIGGDIAAIDPDHVICVTFGEARYPTTPGHQPIYTNNARGACDWAFTNLPQADWASRNFVYGYPSKSFACGYGSDLGTVWAALNKNDPLPGSDHCIIYKSTGSNLASFTQIKDITPFSTSGHGPLLFTVIGYPQHLWLTTAVTGGTTPLKRSVDGGDNWTDVAPPTSITQILGFALGKAKTVSDYPTLFIFGTTGFGADQEVYYSTTQGASWVKIMSSKADLPAVCNWGGLFGIAADWNMYGRLYGSASSQGFVFYEPTPDVVIPPSYTALAVHFDSSDSMARGGGLSSASDGRYGIVSFWIKMTGGNGTAQSIFKDSGSAQALSRTNGNFIALALFSPSFTTVAALQSVTTVTTASGWKHVIASWRADGTPDARMFIDGIQVSSYTPPASTMVDYTKADWIFGGSNFDADIADFYFNGGDSLTNNYLDLTVPANMQKFRSATGLPVDLGTTGNTPTGAQPLIFFKGPAANWGTTNIGSGGNFTVTGTLTDASTNPPLTPVFVPASVNFAGSARMTRSSALTGVVNGQFGLLSLWLRVTGGDGTTETILADQTGSVLLQRETSNKLTFTTSAVATMTSLSIFTGNDIWRHVAICWRTDGTPRAEMWIDGVREVISTPSASTNSTYNAASWTFASFGSSNLIIANVAEFYFNGGSSLTNNYLDLSVPANLQKFRSAAGAPVDLGFYGATPTGVSPLMYFKGPYSNFAVNDGSGGVFTQVGTIGATPADPPSATPLYMAKAVTFNGSSYLTRTAALAGAVDGAYGVCSFWLKINSGTGGQEIFSDASGNMKFVRNPFVFAVGFKLATGIMGGQIGATTTSLAGGPWRHFAICWRTDGTPNARFFVDGVQEATGTPTASTTPVLTGGNWNFGDFAGGTILNGDVADFYWNAGPSLTDNYLDLTVAANLQKFRSATGVPVDLGINGSKPTGIVPLVFFRGPAATFADNSGSGGAFSVTGTLANASSNPGWIDLYSMSLPTDNTGWNNYAMRVAVATAAYNAAAPATGTKLRVTMNAASTTGVAIFEALLGHAAASGDAIDFDGTQVSIKFSGSFGTTIAAGGVLVSDEVLYAFDKTRPLVLSVTYNGPTDVKYVSGTPNFIGAYTPDSGHSLAAISDVSMPAAANRIYLFSKVEVYG